MDSNRFPLQNAIKKILDDPNSRPALKPEPEPPPEWPFPWDLIGVFPDDWAENAQMSRASQDAATRGLDEQLPFGISGSPAVTVFDGKLYCVHEGQNNDGWLWVCTLDGQNWSEDTKLPFGTAGPPALAEYLGKLYCVHEGQNGDGWLWFCTFDGQNWSEDTKLPFGTGVKQRGFPPAALAVYQGILYCVHEGQGGIGQGGDGWLWVCSYDGVNWSEDKKLPFGTTSAPALATLGDRLICLHEGKNKNGWLWYTSFDGKNWSKDVQVQQDSATRGKGGGFGISGPPALVTSGTLLYAVHQGQNNDSWVWSFNNEDQVDKKLTAGGPDRYIGTSFTPGLALYKNSFHVLHHGKDNSGWLWITSTSANRQQPDMEFNLRMPERPSTPYEPLDRYNRHLTEHQPLRDDNHPVEVMRHHIIPDSRLRVLWNRALEAGHLHVAADELLRTIDQNLGQYQMTLNQADIDQLRDLLLGIRSGAVRHNPARRTPDGFDNLAAVYEWLPGNLFIGPRGGNGQYQRTDDPGDGFEENANTIVGADFPHRAANSAIEEYLRSGSEETAEQAFVALSVIARRGEPYALNSYDWIFAHGKYKLRSRGDW